MHLNKPTSRDSFLVISSFAHAWISLSNGSIGGGGEGGGLLGILGGGVPSGSPNPDPQKMPVFFTSILRPGL